MDDLSSTQGIVALAAAGTAAVALIFAIVLGFKLRALRTAQRVVLGERGERDLAVHAADIDREFRSLHSYVEDAVMRLYDRMTTVETRLDGAVAHTAVVRYDAYNEMSGRQSTSIALLDAHRCGIVLSSIHHRDQARLYVKRVHNGAGTEVELSPEEAEVVRAAMANEV